ALGHPGPGPGRCPGGRPRRRRMYGYRHPAPSAKPRPPRARLLGGRSSPRKGVTPVTEAEWQECDDPNRMLDFLRRRASNRKLRLFACACCRRIWHLLTDARSREAVEVAERFADGQASSVELEQAHRKGQLATRSLSKQARQYAVN